jgi:asparagine synthase (glutamine-hydrolysing)
MSWGVIGANVRGVFGESPKNSKVLALAKIRQLGPNLQWATSEGRSVFGAEEHSEPTGESMAVHGHLRLNAAFTSREAEASQLAGGFQQWGIRLGEHVHGDYSAIVWDKAQRQFTGFIDPFGVKQFFYAVFEAHLFYAFDLPSLLSVLPKVPALRQSKLVPFLCREESDPQNTFHESVRRLMPAQFLNWAPEAGLSFKVWHPLQEPSPNFQFSDEQWVEAFRERFIHAVQSRMLRNPLNTGSQLSGGLDSSSIVAAALMGRNGPLTTTSLMFPNHPASDERVYIDEMVNFGGCQSIQIDTSALNPYTSMPGWLGKMGEPYFNPNFYLNQINYQKAAEGGLKFLLDGMDGDIVVSHGMGIPQKLFKQRHFSAMWQALKAIGDTFDRNPSTLFKRLVLKPLLPNYILDWRSKLLTNRTTNEFYQNMTMNDFIRTPFLENSMEFEHLLIKPHENYSLAHAYSITDPLNASIMEIQQSIARIYDIELIYPFFDLELIQLCLNLPDNMIISHESTRYVMRAAMKDLMPDSLRWRNRKGSLSQHLNDAFLHQNWKAIMEELQNINVILKEIVDIPKVIRYWEDCKKYPKLFRYYNVWPLVCLNFWLRQQQHY